MILGILLFIIFLFLSILHFSWALGNSWGFENSLPQNEDGELVLKPSRRDSAIVGIGLLLFGTFYLIKVGLVTLELPTWAVSIASLVIPLIFILRAIGDRKYVGFFKSIKSTAFAKKDTKYYSPLCLIIGLTGLMI
ncbi:DUF3995 domain-containing protein [Ekhidna sp.]